MMSLDLHEINRWADYLDLGLVEGRELDRITVTYPNLSLEDAYRIQAEGVKRRENRGETVIGKKMGLTSKAKREQMGLHTPIFGVLTDQMKVTQPEFSIRGKIHPKIEPEIALVTSRELRGQVSFGEVLESCSGVCAALEILDSRYNGFKYFSLEDVVADNSSSAYFLLGELQPDFRSLQLDRLEMTLSVNGRPVHQAWSKEISGHPVNSVIQLCSLLEAENRSLPAGSIVLTGAATAAVSLEPGQTVSLSVSHLPGVEIRVVSD
jgi:2-oxo-3-hexenedioate decarboxylase